MLKNADRKRHPISAERPLIWRAIEQRKPTAYVPSRGDG
jgi:hypothetical protein